MRLYRFAILAAAIATVPVCHAAAQDTGAIAYHLDTIMHGDDLAAVELTIHFKANASGQTELDLPSDWGGGDKFYDRLKQIEIEGAESITTPSPDIRLIVSKPNASLTVRYRVEANRVRGDDVPYKTTFSYPVVAPDWFFIAGPSLIATVHGREKEKIAFDWTLPSGWTGATNLEYPLSTDTSSGPEQSILMPGRDVHIVSMKVPSGDLRIAWRGQFNFTQDDFNQATHDIIAAEQAFWGEGQAHFLVALSPLDAEPDHQSIRGSGLGDAFPIVATPNADIKALKVVLAHEYFHSWNPERLGGFDDNAQEGSEYWFTEGFTDYYGRKLAFDSGAVDAAEFTSEWNATLAAYAASPYRTSPNAIVAEKFWSDSHIYKLPYQRGAILAALLDARWRTQGKSLDGFMHVLRDQIKADDSLQAKHPNLLERLDRAAKAYDVDFADLIEGYIMAGDDIILPADAFGPGFNVVTEDIPVNDFGYDLAKSKAAGVFVDVDPNGPAYAAGLRDGMKRVSSEGGADSHSLLTWHVIDLDGKPRDITYMPAGKARLRRQKLVAK